MAFWVGVPTPEGVSELRKYRCHGRQAMERHEKAPQEAECKTKNYQIISAPQQQIFIDIRGECDILYI
ncbi:MAG: hypothetical protein A3C36_00805 [Omnitrophica WOR_2 bacterium RIFCSPHIGHO2_02_FULL_52_10]|nr:MAG: hypothetical protein A3C36_00805 [Omnitrophica WOR_2 bacterium RIFCSPHIGHO2_02_FULL_52_10]